MNRPDDFENKIICGDNLTIMPQIPDGSIDLTVTSPPYYNLKEYANWNSWHDYVSDVEKWLHQCFRILKPGRWCIWNILDKVPNPGGSPRYYRLHGETEAIAESVGFEVHYSAIWNKPNSQNQRMFGSYPYPPSIILTQTHEMVCIWRKPGIPAGKRSIYPDNKIGDEWNSGALTIWNIKRKFDKRHLCSFPEKLVTRCIEFWSWPDEIVLDPFMGVGSTALAAIKLGRRFCGCDISQDYCDIANERIAAELAQPDMFIKQPAMIGIGGE